MIRLVVEPFREDVVLFLFFFSATLFRSSFLSVLPLSGAAAGALGLTTVAVVSTSGTTGATAGGTRVASALTPRADASRAEANASAVGKRADGSGSIARARTEWSESIQALGVPAVSVPISRPRPEGLREVSNS
jgi:hypothetical protein